jgi:hypothetical protein
MINSSTIRHREPALHPAWLAGFAAIAAAALTLPGHRAAPVVPTSPAAANVAGLRLPIVAAPAGTAGGARYLGHGVAGTLAFAPSEVVLGAPAGTRLDPVRVRFSQVSPNVELEATGRLAGTVNYLLGKDPTWWRRDVPTFSELRYAGLWFGIDLSYEGTMRALKGTYTVAPGADPSRIAWRYEGADSVSLDAVSGSLVVTAGGRTLTEQAPIAWQEDGERRVPVAAAFALSGTGEASFALGAYDPARPLVIDPYLVYATLIGGSDVDEGRDIALDAAGNVYITGHTHSDDFPGAGPPQATYGGPATSANLGDAFIAKLNPAGDALLYMTYLGGSLSDAADAIAVDPDGNAYVTGYTVSEDFPTVNPFQASRGAQNCGSPPCSDAFVAKLNAAGNALVFSTYLGGDKEENVSLTDFGTRAITIGVAIDATRNVYVTGTTVSTNFPTPGGAYATPAGLADIFVAKLNPSGSAVLYGTLLGGTGADYSGDVAVGSNGTAFITGSTLSSNFPVKNALFGTSGGATDAILARIDTATTGGSSVVWATYLGGSSTDKGYGLVVDGNGAVLACGVTQSLNFPTVNPFQAVNGGAATPNKEDAWLARVDAAGTALQYSTYLGGSGSDIAYAIERDAGNHAFITGRTFSDDLPTREACQTRRYGSSDLLVARIDPAAAGDASLVYSTYLGGNASDIAYGIALDADRNVYVTGGTGGANNDTFPITGVIGPNGTTGGALVAKLVNKVQQWVPVASHAAGANSSQWRTDLGALNTLAGTTTLEARLHSGATTKTRTFQVPSGDQVNLADVVGQLPFTGSGALELIADRGLRLVSRTYNAISGSAACYPNGTFGQNYDAQLASDGLRNLDIGWLPGLRENAAYRTNIALTNTGPLPATAVVTMYNGAAADLAQYTVNLDPGEWKQENRPFFTKAGQTALDRGYARVKISAGYGVIASASVVDNATNDPTTVTMIGDAAGLTDAWLQVGSHATGANSSQWRTDLGVLNTSFSTANVDVKLRSGATLKTSALTVGPGVQSMLEDVVGQLGFTGSGSLEVVSSRAVKVSSRTYNQIAASAACTPGGTLGQNYDALATAAGLAAGETAWVSGLIENGAYRTNIALTNTGAAEATATVDLFDGTGAQVGTYNVTLAAGEWKQENRPFFAKAGRNNLAAAYARVTVSTGSGVIASGSVVNNVTNDPTTIPMIR